MICEETSVAVDVNWLLSANGGVGMVYTDVESIWMRAKVIDDHERQLSFEDEIVDMIRHFGQGHDFSDHLLRTAVDLEAGLLVENKHLDLNYVHKSLKHCSGLSAYSLFYNFYTGVYGARCGGLDLAPVSQDHRWPSKCEKKAFERVVILGQFRRFKSKRAVANVLRELVGLAAKLWAVDTIHQCATLLRLLIAPTREILVLETRQLAPTATSRARIWAYLSRAALCFPLAVVFLAVRMLFAAFRRRKASLSAAS